MRDFNEILGCLTLPAIGGLVWAVIAAHRASARAKRLEAVLPDLTNRVFSLENRVLELMGKLRTGSQGSQATESPAARPADAPRAAEPREATLPPAETASRGIPSPPSPTPAPAPQPALPASSARSDSKPFDWEGIIGVRLFAWLGGAAFFLAAVLFLQYSIQHNLISPAARVAIGFLAGALAVWGGDRLREKADLSGQAISGAGVAILYADIFAAHSIYQLFGSAVASAAMIFVTAAAGVMAVRRSAFMLAVLGLIGGFATPYLLSTGVDRPVSLFFYLLLLSTGVLTVARRKEWPILGALGLAGSAVIYAGWAAKFLDSRKAPYALVAAALLGAIYALRKIVAPAKSVDQHDLTRLIRCLAAGLPFLAALAVARENALSIAAGFLVAYLLILSAGAVTVAASTDFTVLVPAAAAASIVILAARVGGDLFPSHRGATLALLALIPLAFLLNQFRESNSANARSAVAAAAIALGGSFLIFVRATSLELRSEPVAAHAVFAAAMTGGLLVLAARLRKGVWILAALAYSFAALLVLATRFENPRLPEFLPLVIAPAIVFWLLPFASERLRPDRNAWIAGGLSPVAHFAVLFGFAKPSWGTGALGSIAVGIGLASFLSLKRAVALNREDPVESRFAAALFGAVALLFVTASIPILLDKEWITVAWALEAAALAWLFGRIPHEGLLKASALLAAGAFLRLIANPALWEYHSRSGTPIFNWYLYTFGIPAAAFLLAPQWAVRSDFARGVHYPSILRGAAGILLFVLLNVEIADFYSKGPGLTFRLSGGGLAEDMTYSLAWGLFAVALLVIGITRKAKPVRAAALGVLILMFGKVFLHDLWNLGALYRVGSIVALAASLLAVSYLIQRFVLAREPS